MRKLIITFLLAIGLSISSLSIAEVLRIKPNAPARYEVKKGDTLWGISGRYLYKQWDWPKLWGWNKNQIRNPHLIYPGQVLVLRYIDGQPFLGVEGGFRPQPNGMTPRMRVEGSGEAINGVSNDIISLYYKRPIIISEAEYARLPRIVSGRESTVILSKGDRVYSRGITESGTYASYKPNRKIYDPDTNQFLGFEAAYGGDLVVQKLTGEVQTLEVVGNNAEILVGDRLINVTDAPQSINFMPHAYEGTIKGKFVSMPDGGVREAGKYSTITINIGSAQGVENGHVLGAYRAGKAKVIDDLDGTKRTVQLPSEEVGVVMVYRTFENLSYAIVMNSKSEIARGDILAAPGLDMEYFDTSTIYGYGKGARPAKESSTNERDNTYKKEK